MSDITQDINYPKVVYQQLNRWRKARAREFQKLDIDFFKALETNDQVKIQEIGMLKNQLRNVTTYDFSSVKTLNDIYEIWPEFLGEKVDL